MFVHFSITNEEALLLFIFFPPVTGHHYVNLLVAEVAV
jgi:hypothetical protein